MTAVVFTGLLLGIAFGFVLQRGRFCMNSAFRDVVTMKDFTLLKSVGVALLVELIGFTALAMAGVITLNPKPLFWGANIIGGLFFGVGMVIAGARSRRLRRARHRGHGGGDDSCRGICTGCIFHRGRIPKTIKSCFANQHQSCRQRRLQFNVG